MSKEQEELTDNYRKASRWFIAGAIALLVIGFYWIVVPEHKDRKDLEDLINVCRGIGTLTMGLILAVLACTFATLAIRSQITYTNKEKDEK